MQRLALLLCVLAILTPALPVQAQTANDPLAIHSPGPGAVVGGLVSVLGTAEVPDMESYQLSFGPGAEPAQWIPIGQARNDAVRDGRLALWDTTGIPDGSYTLRLRATVHKDGGLDYRDVYVDGIQVSNAPRTATPYPTLQPSVTPTPTLTPTATPTPVPTIALDDGISPYLYLTMTDLYDPLCSGWRQRYSIWISNVGMISVTNVIVTQTLPLGLSPILSDSTPGGVADKDENSVTWQVEALEPGEAVKFELQVDVADWLETGEWITTQTNLTSDQVPYLAKSETSLLSECVWLRQTATARPMILPTAAPTDTPTPSPSPTETEAASGRPTVFPSPSRTLAIDIDDPTISRSLDLVTVLISVGLGGLLVATVYMLRRRGGSRK